MKGLVSAEEAETGIWEEWSCVYFGEVVEGVMNTFVACEGQVVRDENGGSEFLCVI
jgi:hypothetical protein